MRRFRFLALVMCAVLLATNLTQSVSFAGFFFHTIGKLSVTVPTSLSLTHSPNNQSFTVSWTAGSGNGGAAGCRLQYLRDDTTWTNLSGTYNCDANVSFSSASLPTSDYWTNNFNGTGVQIRLVRISDTAVMGTFSQRAVCYSSGGSGFSTPTVDENCNSAWDDSYYNPNIVAGCSAGNQCLQGQYYYNDAGYTSPNNTCLGFPQNSGGPFCGPGGGCYGGTPAYGVTTGSGCTHDAGGSTVYY